VYSIVVVIVAAVLYITLAYLLVRRYIRTRNQGFIWLGIAFLVWPNAQILLRIYQTNLLHRVIAGQYPSWFPAKSMTPGAFMSYFAMTQGIILPILLVVAVYYLGNRKTEVREALT